MRRRSQASPANVVLRMPDTLNSMRRILALAIKAQIWKDRRAQDLIEYALMAGFVAVAAGAIMPGVGSSINLVFSKVNSILVKAAAS